MAEVIEMQSVSTFIAQIKAAWDRADEKQTGVDAEFIRVGKMLIELKKRIPRGQWQSTVKKLGRSPRTASDLMSFAKGSPIIAKRRERHRNYNRKLRKEVTEHRNRKVVADLPKRGQPLSEDPEQYFGDDDDVQSEERWGYSLGNICGNIIAIAPYWDREFPQWRDYECPRHIQKLLMDATAALASIATAVKRGRKVS